MAKIITKNKRSKVPQMQLGERATTGCRNPRPTRNHRQAFAIITSRH